MIMSKTTSVLTNGKFLTKFSLIPQETWIKFTSYYESTYVKYLTKLSLIPQEKWIKFKFFFSRWDKHALMRKLEFTPYQIHVKMSRAFS